MFAIPEAYTSLSSLTIWNWILLIPSILRFSSFAVRYVPFISTDGAELGASIGFTTV